MADAPKSLDIRVAELESAVRKLTESATPMAAGQGLGSGATCVHVCQICVICVAACACVFHPVGMACAGGGICHAICNECTCGPCAQ